MASMVIRNIPDDVLERFKKRARDEGKSAEQMAREVLVEKARPPRDEIVRRMAELRSRSRPVDLETALKIMDEARAERDASPHIPGPGDDR